MLLAVLDSNAITFRTSVGLFHRLLNIDIGRLRGDCARFDVWVCVSVRVDVFACLCVFFLRLSLSVCVRACVRLIMCGRCAFQVEDGTSPGASQGFGRDVFCLESV